MLSYAYTFASVFLAMTDMFSLRRKIRMSLLAILSFLYDGDRHFRQMPSMSDKVFSAAFINAEFDASIGHLIDISIPDLRIRYGAAASIRRRSSHFHITFIFLV